MGASLGTHLVEVEDVGHPAHFDIGRLQDTSLGQAAGAEHGGRGREGEGGWR